MSKNSTKCPKRWLDLRCHEETLHNLFVTLNCVNFNARNDVNILDLQLAESQENGAQTAINKNQTETVLYIKPSLIPLNSINSCYSYRLNTSQIFLNMTSCQ